MAPLLQLKDIALTFGGTPLLSGAELVRLSRRAGVAGRAQRIGKIDIAQNRGRAGRTGPRLHLRAAGSAGALPAAGAGFFGLRVNACLCRGRAAAGRRPPCRPLSPGATRPHRAGRSGAALRGRGTPRRAGAGLGAIAGYPAARRTDQSSRSDDHRMAGARTGFPPRRHGDHQPRPALPFDVVAEHGLARPRTDAAHRAWICPFRGMARCGAGGGGTRPAQARPQNRRRGALAALRRHRPAQAQHAPGRPIAGAAGTAPQLSRRRRQCHHHRRFGGAVRRAGRSRRPASARAMAAARSSAISRSASSAATASASSGRTAAARPR